MAVMLKQPVTTELTLSGHDYVNITDKKNKKNQKKACENVVLTITENDYRGKAEYAWIFTNSFDSN